jgi:hypothetical protein
MRRYNIVTRILLILSIIDFALAAPVLVQEKRQAFVDAVLIPKDVITELGKRSDEELEKKPGEDHIKTWGELSDAHVSAQPAPGTDNNDVKANPAALSTAKPNSLMETSSYSSSTSKMQGLRARGNVLGQLAESWHDVWSYYKGFDDSAASAAKSPPYADPDWEYWGHLLDLPPPPLKESGQASGHAPSPPDSHSVYSYPETLGHSSSPGVGPPTEPEHDVLVTPPSRPKDEGIHVPPPMDPGLHLDPQSSSSDSQPVDPQSAMARYAAKGKAKQSRRIYDIARDTGDVTQRGPAERSLGPVGCLVLPLLLSNKHSNFMIFFS